MTKRQAQALDWLVREMWRKYEYSPHAECKQLKVEDHKGFVSVVMEMGLLNDEGTMAQAFGRDYRHFAIARGGAVELLNAKKKSQRYSGSSGMIFYVQTAY